MRSRPFRPAVIAGTSAVIGAAAAGLAATWATATGKPALQHPVAVTGTVSAPSSTASGENWTPDTSAYPPAAQDPVRNTSVVEAVRKVAPAVVSITCESPVESLFGRVYGEVSTSEGSGVVIQSDGIVLTNAHVVNDAAKITVQLADGTTYNADTIGISQNLDLAVLRLRGAKGLVVAPIGTSSDLMLGEPVIAIGNPFGLSHTVTTGVISALSRPLETDNRVYQDFIQTDASINPGNSGGPLLDVHGRLVGINTAIRQHAQGIGFAIPVDRAIKVARDLVQFGQVQIPWLGVELDDAVVRIHGARAIAPEIVQVQPQSAAAAAGLQVGDVLIGVDGRPVRSRADLNAYLATYEPGREVTLDLLRDGSAYTVQLRTGKLPMSVVDETIRRVLGFEPANARNGGVVVRSVLPGGEFARYGLRPGDRVVAVNGVRIDDVDQLRAAIARAKSGHRSSAMITVQRGRAFGSISLFI